jgi:hypothetical protein
MEYTPWMIVVGAILLIGLIGIVSRLFFRLLKHVIIAIIIGVAAAFVYVQLQPKARVNPAVGKFAYSSANGVFVGKVVAVGTDAKMGDVLIIERPGGYHAKYPKNFLLLRDK